MCLHAIRCHIQSFAVTGYKALHGVTWSYMELHGVTWRYMALHGVTWRYMALHGVTWRYMVNWYFAVSSCNEMLSWSLNICNPLHQNESKRHQNVCNHMIDA
jgi:hypothetical protein